MCLRELEATYEFISKQIDDEKDEFELVDDGNLVLVQDCMIEAKRVTFREIAREGDVSNTLRCPVVQPPVNHARYLHKAHAALLLES